MLFIEEGITQTEIAEKVGVSLPYVNRIIRGREQIVNKTFIKILDELGYLRAKNALEAGDFTSAYADFKEIIDYKDSKDILQTNENLKKIREERVGKLKTVGNTVKFGHYDQDSKKNSAEDIKWIVLEVQGNKCLLMSKYALSTQRYNSKSGDCTWENSSLRTWLNSSFINEAFSAEEQEFILTTSVDNSKEQGDSYDRYKYSLPGNKTNDKIYLLSVQEVYKYLKQDSDKKCTPVSAINVNSLSWFAYNEDYNYIGWWTRSAKVEGGAYLVDTKSSVVQCEVTDTIGVRPVMWIDLSSIIY